MDDRQWAMETNLAAMQIERAVSPYGYTEILLAELKRKKADFFATEERDRVLGI
jgi:hypothetical protein